MVCPETKKQFILLSSGKRCIKGINKLVDILLRESSDSMGIALIHNIISQNSQGKKKPPHGGIFSE